MQICRAIARDPSGFVTPGSTCSSGALHRLPSPRLWLVLILELVINRTAAQKLADRGIGEQDVREVISNGPLVVPNPLPRVRGSLVAIGVTKSARFLALILQPDEDSAIRWHVMTGWDASPRQIDAFHRRG